MPGLRRAASLFLFAWPGRGTAVIDELAAGASVGRDSLIVTETLADNLKKRDQSFFGSGEAGHAGSDAGSQSNHGSALLNVPDHRALVRRSSISGAVRRRGAALTGIGP
jgi:hypothetical protein